PRRQNSSPEWCCNGRSACYDDSEAATLCHWCRSWTDTRSYPYGGTHMRRIVITGIGLITPLGIGVAPTWQGLIEGRSGLGPIRSFDPSSLRTQIAGEVHDFQPQPFVKNRRTLRLMMRCDQFAFAATSLALQDAGLASVKLDCDRTGIFL